MPDQATKVYTIVGLLAAPKLRQHYPRRTSSAHMLASIGFGIA